MKYLVLGSEGQIGWHLCRYLLSKGEEVEEFDILRGEREDLRIINNALLKKKMKESDFIYFLAFDVGGSSYMQKYQNTYNFISNNIKIMNNVFDEIKEQGKPFIFASSQMSNMMHSAYGVLKMAGEKYTLSLGGMIVKFWNVYGYERDPDKTHVITDFILMAKRNKKIVMRTSGEEERQFLYGDDAAGCLHTLSKQYSIIDKKMPLHITNFEWTKIIDIAGMISQNFEGCEIVKGSANDSLQMGIKNEPDRYILGFWEPVVSVKEGIKKTIQLFSGY